MFSKRNSQGNSFIYILIVLGLAVLLGRSVIIYYRPILFEAECSDIAAKSSGLRQKEVRVLAAEYSYESVKAKCLEDSKK